MNFSLNVNGKTRKADVERARQARAELHEMFERDFVAIRRQREQDGPQKP